MADIEVHIDLGGESRLVGLARRNLARGAETVVFEYADAWLAVPQTLALEPALPLTRGSFPPARNQAIFGSLGDSAPDSWGRQLMQRAERRTAQREARPIRTLFETDYLLGVSDEPRFGALRFRQVGVAEFQAPSRAGVTAIIELGRLIPRR